MNPTVAVGLGVVGILWLFLLFMIFRPPDPPRIGRLAFFVLWLVASFVLIYFALISVYKWNPNPLRVDTSRMLTKDKMIYLGDIVPGLYDLDYIHRVDTDWVNESLREEWLAFYQYDVTENPDKEKYNGPFGAAIYDYDDCRPPAILSYELVPASYDYLGEQEASVKVENIIVWQDPVSGNADRPEVMINGVSRHVVTDLNIFRRSGVELNCLDRQQWQVTHAGEAFPNPLRYENIGSFRGNHQVRRNGSTVTVLDRAGFERSQFVIEKIYEPRNGTYFLPDGQTLLDPVEYSLGFGTGEPDDVPQVYYPEKAVLAFYLNLGKDDRKLEQANSYLSPAAQQRYDIRSDSFGLSTSPDSVAQARNRLNRVLVWAIRYEPDVEAEQLHKARQVTVTVVGVGDDGAIDYAHPCQVTWSVIGHPRSGALPYGCEWRLDQYQSSCASP